MILYKIYDLTIYKNLKKVEDKLPSIRANLGEESCVHSDNKFYFSIDNDLDFFIEPIITNMKKEVIHDINVHNPKYTFCKFLKMNLEQARYYDNLWRFHIGEVDSDKYKTNKKLNRELLKEEILLTETIIKKIDDHNLFTDSPDVIFMWKDKLIDLQKQHDTL